jgi:hypothetical protein
LTGVGNSSHDSPVARQQVASITRSRLHHHGIVSFSQRVKVPVGLSGPSSAAEHEPGEALARWIWHYADFILAKRGLAKALHCGDPVFDIEQRLEPALRTLLKSAASAGQVRPDIAAEELLGAVVSLCMQPYAQGPQHARRMVSLLVDGLRCGASSHPKSKKVARRKT